MCICLSLLAHSDGAIAVGGLAPNKFRAFIWCIGATSKYIEIMKSPTNLHLILEQGLNRNTQNTF